MKQILFIVRNRAGSANDREVVLCNGADRETAKRIAFPYLLGNADQYTVEPITRDGDTIHLAALGHIVTANDV